MLRRLTYHWLMVIDYMEYKSLIFVSLDFYEKNQQCFIVYLGGFNKHNFGSLHILHMRLCSSFSFYIIPSISKNRYLQGRRRRKDSPQFPQGFT